MVARRRARRFEGTQDWVPYAVLIASVLLTLIVWRIVTAVIKDRNSKRFEAEYARATFEMDSKIEDQVQLAQAAAAFVRLKENVTAEGFRQFLEWQGWPGKNSKIGTIGYSARFPVSQLDAFTKKARAEGAKDFEAQPEPDRPVVDAVLFFEPKREGHGPAGTNLFHDPVRHQAMIGAERTGQPTASGKVMVYEDPYNKVPAIVVFVPVYAGPPPLHGFGRPRGELTGFTFTTIRLKATLAEVFSGPNAPDVEVTIYDGSHPEKDPILFDDSQKGRSAEFKSPPKVVSELGRDWSAVYRSSKEFERQGLEPLVPVLPIGGLFVSGLLFALSWRQNKAQRDVARFAQTVATAEEELSRVNEHLERLVEERTGELRLAIDELEAFCYSVSHDLRTPLRSIDGFSKALMEDYGSRLEEDGLDFLRRIRAAATRMDELITTLLTLSRLTRAEIAPHWVDATALVKQIAHDNDPDDKVQFDIAEGLAIFADEQMLHVFLDNLISNAVKFSSNVSAPRVEIGKTDDACYIRDNGAGFDPRFGAKLFQPFERLHTVREFPGSGIGLATAARIVKRHGGAIWASSISGHGATFFFSFPEPVTPEIPEEQ